MSVARRPLIWHRRMNLQHAAQHSLNVSLTRLHTNKPAGTHGLTPTLVCFDIFPAHMIRTKSKKNVFICILWTLECSHYIWVNLECLCWNMLPQYEQKNNNSVFMCTNILEYVNYHFLLIQSRITHALQQKYQTQRIGLFPHNCLMTIMTRKPIIQIGLHATGGRISFIDRFWKCEIVESGQLGLRWHRKQCTWWLLW